MASPHPSQWRKVDDGAPAANSPLPLPTPPLPENGGETVAPRIRGRLEVFREEISSILSAELANVEREFEQEILELEARLAQTRDENMRRATELARLKLESSTERQRRDKETHRLEQALAVTRADLTQAQSENRDLSERYLKLQAQFAEKAAALDRMERAFHEELGQREREIKELTAMNGRFERKINVLMEVQRRLEDTLGNP